MPRRFDHQPVNLPHLYLPALVPPGTLLLERPADATGFDASHWLLRAHTRAGLPPRLRIPFHKLPDICSQEGVPPRVVVAPASEGGMLLFHDRSLLIYRNVDLGEDDTAWAHIEVMPIVLRLCPLRLRALGAEPAFSSLGGAVSATTAVENPVKMNFVGIRGKVVTQQVFSELSAWLRLMPELPAIDVGRDWPACFPLMNEKGLRLDAFRQDLKDILSSVHAWLPGAFLEVFATVSASRPLQGGFEPLRVDLSWRAEPFPAPLVCPPSLTRHVRGCLFAEDMPWRLDDFPGQVFHTGPGEQGGGRVRELFSLNVSPPLGGHAAAALIARFPKPVLEESTARPSPASVQSRSVQAGSVQAGA